ncbi:MAG TPA: Gfo/Idh/MocA family oxidoreductase [Bryobacterales bacterium]|nr:Gfo/Idh/MocA family oxidoreductase [Bryobacterales bacterium]
MPNETQVDRREFLARTVGAAAAAATLPRLKAQSKSPNSTVQYGFIGPGSRGQTLLRHLSKIDTGRCVAMCDIYAENLKKGIATIGSNPEGYYDYRELLARKDIDAVYIAVPLYKHFEVTKAALEAGKNVFCEKSLVFTPEEVHELRKLAAEHPNQIIQVGLQRRYSKFYQVARQMIDKGMLGRVTHMHAQWHRNSDWRRPVKDPKLEEQINWRMYTKYSGGLSAELASHQLDVAEWMLGHHWDTVVGVGGLDYWKDGRDIYDNIQLIYTYPEGKKLTYSSITTNEHMPFKGLEGIHEVGEVIMGDGGTIEISLGRGMWYREPHAPKYGKAGAAKENWTAGATEIAAAESKGFPIVPGQDVSMNQADSFITREVKFAKRWLYDKGVLVPEETRDPVAVELDSFLHDVRDHGTPRANLEVGLNDSIGVILSNLAMREERRVKWDEIETLGTGKAAASKKLARS